MSLWINPPARSAFEAAEDATLYAARVLRWTLCAIDGAHMDATAAIELAQMADMDARLIIQVITNLVDNAVKYTPEGSTIMVNSRQEGASAVIDVSDNGPGIPDESKEKIFEMFYTTGHKSADGKRGMGLGLPLCRAILSAHKGTIEVLDNKPAGSIFRLTLPAKEVSLHE